ncbi:MAG: hypothetical protein BV459_07310 [Thermoplasmata archaeon M11B2D]|nr:MAG: hypothetical protein BV459_07310 [Thermoplasmata archaeon M11B2D]
MKKLLYGVFALISLTLVACGAKVEVPPAHVGKVLTKNGYAPETITPSKFRLPPCWVYCDKLVLLQANDAGIKEEFELFMPKDKLNLHVEVRGTLSIQSDPKTVDALYSRIVATEDAKTDVSTITVSQIYGVYGQQALRGIVRSELVKYTISEILENRDTVGESIHAALTKKLQETHTPIVVSRFELADIQPPAIIVKAQEAAKKREIDIQTAEANAQVQLVEAERALEVAKKDRLVEREKAEAIAEQNRIAAQSITPQLLAYRRLEVAERIYSELAKSNNVVIVPADASSFSTITDDAVLAKMLGQEFKGVKK